MLLIENTRKTLAIAPEKLYPEMFRAIKAKAWSKFGKALVLLSDLIKDVDKVLNSKLHIILTTAYEQKNIKIAERNTHRLITSSAKVLLREVLNNDRIDKKEYCKQAFKELHTLENIDSKYNKANFADDFALALDNLTKPSKLKGIITKIITKIDALK